MTFINEYTMYCAICGGPIEDLDGDHGWLLQVVLLHSKTEFPHTEILELPARSKGGPYFELLETAEAITACDKSGSVVPSPRPLYIPCHTKCISVAKRAMAFQEVATHRSVGCSMQHLWDVFQNLFHRASEEKFGPICNIYSAQAYGDIWRFQELQWQPGNDPNARFDSELFEADPEDVPGMTNSILSQLQALPAVEVRPSSSDPSELPQPRHLSLDCTFHSSPSAWREGFAHGYLPWLWDLELDAIADKEASKPPEQEWNWELLVRQLAQFDLREPRAVLQNLPMGLTNRRRIWRLVEDILSAEVADYYDTQWPKEL